MNDNDQIYKKDNITEIGKSDRKIISETIIVLNLKKLFLMKMKRITKAMI